MHKYTNTFKHSQTHTNTTNTIKPQQTLKTPPKTHEHNQIPTNTPKHIQTYTNTNKHKPTPQTPQTSTNTYKHP
jgi:hypothetical protein